MGRPATAKIHRPPQQQRSERTLSRLVDAARRTLERKSLEGATVSELARSAGLSVGAIYSRFPDKKAFLRYLEEESYERLQAAFERLHGDQELPDANLASALRTFVSQMAALYREHRGAMRSILLRSWADPARQERRMAFTAEVIDRTVDRLLRLEGPPRHPKPRLALKIALHMASSALRGTILFDEDWWREREGPSSDEELAGEITRAVLAYLQPAPFPRRRRS